MKITIVILTVLIALTVVTPAYADDGDIKRTCTVKDNWFTKLFDPCVDVSLPVSQPSVVTIDTTKWMKALEDAETYLRTHNNGNNDPVDQDNFVRNTAWSYYCKSLETPRFDVTGNPVCGQ